MAAAIAVAVSVARWSGEWTMARGGPIGMGLTHGKQKLFYLPEAHTDFIYAVICEELGLVGSLGGTPVGS